MDVSSSGSSPKPMNNLILGVSEVFDQAEEAQYLEQRIKQWDVNLDEQLPVLREMPTICSPENFPAVEDPKMAHWVAARTDCLRSSLDYYFSPMEGEMVEEDFFSFLVEPYGAQPPGTVVARRTTNKAVLFAVAIDWRVDVDAVRLVRIAPQPILQAAAPIFMQTSFSSQDTTTITTVYSVLATGISVISPAVGAVFQIGAALVGAALGETGSGPSLEEMRTMIQDVVHDELVQHDLQMIHSKYVSVVSFINTDYLPNKTAKTLSPELLNMLMENITDVRDANSTLLESNYHNESGLALLLIGVPMELALYQERIQIGIGTSANIKQIGADYANKMLKIWGKVQEIRKGEITHSEGHCVVNMRGPDPQVVTKWFWYWKDTRTNETKGTENGPWAVDKHHNDEAGCTADMEQHITEMIKKLSNEFGNPEDIAKKWRNVRDVQIPGQV